MQIKFDNGKIANKSELLENAEWKVISTQCIDDYSKFTFILAVIDENDAVVMGSDLVFGEVRVKFIHDYYLNIYRYKISYTSCSSRKSLSKNLIEAELY